MNESILGINKCVSLNYAKIMFIEVSRDLNHYLKIDK